MLRQVELIIDPRHHFIQTSSNFGGKIRLAAQDPNGIHGVQSAVSWILCEARANSKAYRSPGANTGFAFISAFKVQLGSDQFVRGGTRIAGWNRSIGHKDGYTEGLNIANANAPYMPAFSPNPGRVM